MGDYKQCTFRLTMRYSESNKIGNLAPFFNKIAPVNPPFKWPLKRVGAQENLPPFLHGRRTFRKLQVNR